MALKAITLIVLLFTAVGALAFDVHEGEILNIIYRVV